MDGVRQRTPRAENRPQNPCQCFYNSCFAVVPRMLSNSTGIPFITSAIIVYGLALSTIAAIVTLFLLSPQLLLFVAEVTFIIIIAVIAKVAINSIFSN